MRLWMLLAALAPAAVWLAYYRERDGFAADAEDVWTAVATGAVMTLAAAGLHLALVWLGLPPAPEGLHGRALTQGVLLAALPEEALKLAAVLALLARHRLRARPLDVVILSAAVAAGFAALENMFYVDTPRWGATAAVRSLTAVPSHIFSGVVMGACITAALSGRGRAFWALALLVPVTMHGLYDYLVFLEVGAASSAVQAERALAAPAYEGFIVVVMLEGWIANRCFRALAGNAPPEAAKPPRHWMSWRRTRHAAWGGGGALLLLAGAVMISSGFSSGIGPVLAYRVIGMGLFALYHGLAFIAHARRIDRAYA